MHVADTFDLVAPIWRSLTLKRNARGPANARRKRPDNTTADPPSGAVASRPSRSGAFTVAYNFGREVPV
jgi:hypothetical protein